MRQNSASTQLRFSRRLKADANSTDSMSCLHCRSNSCSNRNCQQLWQDETGNRRARRVVFGWLQVKIESPVAKPGDISSLNTWLNLQPGRSQHFLSASLIPEPLFEKGSWTFKELACPLPSHDQILSDVLTRLSTTRPLVRLLSCHFETQAAEILT